MEKTIKYWPALFFLLFLFSGCCECPVIQAVNRNTLIFIDKSKSAELSSPAYLSQIKENLETMLDTTIRQAGDRVEIRLIHGGTIDAAKVFSAQFAEELPCECGKKSIEFTQDTTLYTQKLRNLRQSVLDEVEAQVLATSNNTATLETDLLGTLAAAADFFKNAPAAAPKTILYLSDMVHSQAAPRDYQLSPLKDKNDAEAAAQHDWMWVQQQYGIRQGQMTNARVYLWFPGELIAKTQTGEMKYYWKEMFRLVDASVRVESN